MIILLYYILNLYSAFSRNFIVVVKKKKQVRYILVNCFSFLSLSHYPKKNIPKIHYLNNFI